jgi:hydroxypyruvate isomerase
MPRFAANLSMLFPELRFLDRFAAAAAAGFKGVEFLFPYEHGAAIVAERARAAAVEVVLFNTWPGDWEAGERGLAALPGREADFAAAVATAIDYATTLGCARVHLMAGIPPADADPAACRATYVANLKAAAAMLAPHGITGLIEPINRRDIPGYHLNRQDDAHAVVQRVSAANLAVQMDLYHCQIVEGDLATKLSRYIGGVGHIQIAGVPERHEPDTGEVNYAYLFALMDQLGYAGWVGCEYRPAADTMAGLDWARPYGVARHSTAPSGAPLPASG